MYNFWNFIRCKKGKSTIPGVILNGDIVLNNLYDIVNNFAFAHFKSIDTNYSIDIINYSDLDTNVPHINANCISKNTFITVTEELKNKLSCDFVNIALYKNLVVWLNVN